MVYNQQHMLLAWGGEFIAGDSQQAPVEQFAGSLRFVGPGVEGAQTEDALDALTQALVTHWQRPEAHIPNRAVLGWVKWNTIDVEGRYVNRNATLARYDIGINGTASMTFPLQIAWCTTWTTDVNRGLAARGRTYWPTGVPLSPSLLRVNGEDCTDKARVDYELVQNLSTAAAGAVGTALVPAVMSNLRGGASYVITGARVGDRLDVQRRRGNSFPEAYYTSLGPTG